MDDDLKNKIVRTIKFYEENCENMQKEIKHLRKGISELARLQMGFSSDWDDKICFFNEVINDDVDAIIIKQKLNSVVSALNNLLEKNSENILDDSDLTILPKKINEHLRELLQCLKTPPELTNQLVSIERTLEHNLNAGLLIQVIEEIKNLVIELFGKEQYQLKFLLENITNQLLQVSNYLKTTFEHNKISKEERSKLELGIQATLDNIQSNMSNATSIEELTDYLNKNLNFISSQIQSYKKAEDLRLQSYESQISELQKKMMDFEEKNAQMKKTIIDQSIQINTDTLTKIANRNFYNISIQKAYSRWQTTGVNIVLALADIDHFKNINDKYGHLTGDKVLMKIASIFQDSMRSIDFLARYGGEEFVVIFEGLSLEQSKEKLENLRLEIENFHFLFRGNRVPVTVSFGLTNIIQGDDTDSLFTRADEALYKAKNNGRNQIVAWDGLVA
ncbi:TPA: GGDEF domain-containing protein [Legionella anisa]|nr:GGDEF domain-containing protein [Legionella anisa]MBN5936859.1 GGDEF domain-containing protein [Legionella anisa]MCW8426710.1 GGDEF domain-containing protein [Legionella anisa]MCW8448374.1 GGDEF domain-containing protein [Legionella anisa]UAK78974.1 GGDEF domain-containing protein [Legionella anisa]